MQDYSRSNPAQILIRSHFPREEEILAKPFWEEELLMHWIQFNQERLPFNLSTVIDMGMRTGRDVNVIVFWHSRPHVMSSGLDGGEAEHNTGIPPRGLDTGDGWGSRWGDDDSPEDRRRLGWGWDYARQWMTVDWRRKDLKFDSRCMIGWQETVAESEWPYTNPQNQLINNRDLDNNIDKESQKFKIDWIGVKSSWLNLGWASFEWHEFHTLFSICLNKRYWCFWR